MSGSTSSAPMTSLQINNAENDTFRGLKINGIGEGFIYND
jgi:hypothetical protein